MAKKVEKEKDEVVPVSDVSAPDGPPTEVKQEPKLTQEQFVEQVRKNATVQLALKEIKEKGVLVLLISKDKESKSFKDFSLLSTLLIGSKAAVLQAIGNESDSHIVFTVVLGDGKEYPSAQTNPFIFDLQGFE